MFAIDDPTAVAALPTPEAAGTPGFFTEGNPGLGQAATYVRASWLNMMQQELLNVVTDAGLTPSKTVYNQLLQALKLKYATVPQVAGVVGSVRNLRAGLTAAAATAAFTADEVIVESALGGIRYCLPSFNKTINLATTGAGGMDTGTAPVSGWVAIYAIYNPTTGTSAVLAANATAAAAPEVYGGANMPAGYTASALISILQTTAGSLLSTFRQFDREVYVFLSVYSGAGAGTFTSLSIAGAVPRNAWRWKGNIAITPSGAGQASAALCPTNSGQGTPGYIGTSFYAAASSTAASTLVDCPILTAQTTFFVTSGVGTWNINSYGFTF